MAETAYRYDPYRRRLVDTDALPTPTIVDSWLAVDGRVRAVKRHFARFSASVDGHAERQHVQAFLAQATSMIPREGAWFPRLEYDYKSGMALRLRPAPARNSDAILWGATETDPRHSPRTKGPDLPALMRVRERAQRAGAHEAVLVGPDGVVREATFATLMWWEGDVLCGPERGEAVLPSVTRELVEAIAGVHAIGVNSVSRSWEHVRNRPMWLLNALHGIRTVTAVAQGQMDVPVPQTSDALVEAFRRDLDTYSQPIVPG